MAPGDICLASFPFGDAPGMKLRPGLTPYFFPNEYSALRVRMKILPPAIAGVA